MIATSEINTLRNWYFSDSLSSFAVGAYETIRQAIPETFFLATHYPGFPLPLRLWSVLFQASSYSSHSRVRGGTSASVSAGPLSFTAASASALGVTRTRNSRLACQRGPPPAVLVRTSIGARSIRTPHTSKRGPNFLFLSRLLNQQLSYCQFPFIPLFFKSILIETFHNHVSLLTFQIQSSNHYQLLILNWNFEISTSK